MAGLAQTEAFMLGSASIMLGPVADLMILEHSHSIGLVKNVTLKTAPSFTELMQGIKNTLVYSVMTGNDITIEGEVFEFTGRNMTYAAGLDGSAIVTPATATKNLSGVVASSTTITIVITGFTVGDKVMVQMGADDQVMIRTVSAAATGTLTLGLALPSTYTVGATVKVSKCNQIALGSQADQPFLSCKIVGTMANGEEAVILVPKVRITSGLNYGFATDNFGNIPMAMKAYDLVSTDPFYTYFQTVGPEGSPAKAQLSLLQ